MVSQAGMGIIFSKQTLLVCSPGHTRHLACFIQSLAPIRMLKQPLLIALELDFVGISPLAPWDLYLIRKMRQGRHEMFSRSMWSNYAKTQWNHSTQKHTHQVFVFLNLPFILSFRYITFIGHCWSTFWWVFSNLYEASKRIEASELLYVVLYDFVESTHIICFHHMSLLSVHFL